MLRLYSNSTCVQITFTGPMYVKLYAVGNHVGVYGTTPIELLPYDIQHLVSRTNNLTLNNLPCLWFYYVYLITPSDFAKFNKICQQLLEAGYYFICDNSTDWLQLASYYSPTHN